MKDRSSDKARFALSVCIPVFNFDIRFLIMRLANEISAKEYQDRVEFIVVDDCSTNIVLKEVNRQFISEKDVENCQYIEFEQNVGRAKGRNVLSERASGDFLLFIDADVLPDNPDFLEKYLTYISEDRWDVICGGLSYQSRIMNEKEYDFYVYMSGKLNVKPAKTRNIIPWRYLWTSNIMVRKSVFLSTPFDERFVGYGYEDAEWGIRLSKRYKVLHIDNTVSHLGLITKKNVYQKMVASIGNYLLLAKIHPRSFQESSVSKIIKCLILLNSSMLENIDNLLKKMFFSINDNRLSLLLLQFNKAILLARQQKSNEYEST